MRKIENKDELLTNLLVKELTFFSIIFILLKLKY